MKPLLTFLGVLALIVALCLVILWHVDPELVWLGVVWIMTCWALVRGYAAYIAGHTADLAWQAKNPRPAKPEKCKVPEGLRVVRGSDGPGKRVLA